ncbi:MAG: ammonia-forming cytochrome c nitrite reductase subunit c552 [Chthoniobacter sp.]|uniref:ammonia-forming cytochrome c nitrite reductase subunit c552 n=1 Tax=Chthoniobacter sp. TaxID=2510640 RepID=UPI0032AE1A72
MSRRKKKPPTSDSNSSPSKADAKTLFWERVLGVWLALFCLGLIGLAAWWLMTHGSHPPAGDGKPAATPAAKFSLEPEAKVMPRYAGSESCRDCHAAEFGKWQGSHHQLAERKVDAKLDGVAFEPPKEIKAGTLVSQAHVMDGKFVLTTAGLKSPQENFTPDRVIGVDPVRQFLVAGPGGRWQSTELAWDPHKQEWFDVYGNEDRQPGEWGHWTGRGMTWNQMCASCHNTRVRKNYDVKEDSYHTAMAEMTVGCEACHGPMRAHVDWQKTYAAKQAPSAGEKKVDLGKTGDPTLVKLSRDQMLDTCGMCHARRVELTGDFVPGDKFSDHFGLSIPDDSELFYPDGQVHDEDYEFTSFLGSKMHAAGVRCMDCHDAHTSKNVVEGNALCMRCHGTPVAVVPTVAVAPQIIDPDHSFHKAGTAGSRCVDCHMPETTYMQRHARRDHGFTIPDPLLTKEHNIPNSCNRCHADKTADWALEACNKWYGDKMNRPTRTRAQWVAQARAAAPGAHTHLLKMLGEEKNPFWRAVAANLLRGSIHEEGVLAALESAAKDPSEMVRGMAARALAMNVSNSTTGETSVPAALLTDPSRSVRIDAAWGQRRMINPESHAGSELLHYLNFNRDQPTGLTQWATYLEDRGDAPGALAAFRQAVDWDHGSAPLRSNYAIALSMAGKSEEAVQQLAEAVKLAPRDSQLRYTFALGLAEVNRSSEARGQLEQAVQLDPQFGRAWYNLGLARNAAGQAGPALEALARAEALDSQNAQAPYAAATILANLRRGREAADAARRALKIDPNYREASDLLRMLSGQGGG